MEGQVEENVKESRNQELLALINANVERKLAACVGSRMEILCEGESRHNSERLMGRTRTNKIVVFEGAERHVGQVMDVNVVGRSKTTLFGDVVLNAV